MNLDTEKFPEFEKFKELRANLDKSFDGIKKIKADMGDMEDDNNSEMIDYLCQCVSSMKQYMYSLEDNMCAAMCNHANQHTPKLVTASQVENFLKAIGASKDYTVVKPVLFASDKNNSLEVEIQFKK